MKRIGVIKVKTYWKWGAFVLAMGVLAGCTDDTATEDTATQAEPVTTVTTEQPKQEETKQETVEQPKKEAAQKEEAKQDTTVKTASHTKDALKGYKKITVDGGDRSGSRQAKVVVDIGFGDRKYWAYTNEYGQLIRVTAAKITLQNDETEPVLSTGRYYADEAKVPGVERSDLDEGHVIADSLGGVSNAYNITPQDSTLNRHGDQAYMEKAIRDAGGATNFEAIITYPNKTTQIPSKYKYTYTIRGHQVVDEFENGNPDKTNESLGLTKKKTEETTTTKAKVPATGDLSKVDTNGNGQVTIKEAKEAGYSMPITRDHWLYPYMDDRDGDGTVGE